VLEVGLALVAALLFALGTVLQQKEAQEVSDEDAHRAGFLLRLAKRPVWLAGMATDGAGFVAQAIALDLGRIVVIQPVIASTVVFALPLGARILGQPVTRRQMGAALVFTAGLAAFLVLANPGGGREDATTQAWIIALVVAAAVCIPLYLAGRFARTPAAKATLLGIATGVLWGYSAALTKGVMEDLHDGPIAVITDWQFYALIAVGWASLTLAQLSLQAGALAPAVATQAALDPVASALLGLLIFDETLDAGTAALVGAGAGFVAMVVAIVLLAASQPPPPET
jgi:drug/metabolite transporter (DMT)-like permease